MNDYWNDPPDEPEAPCCSDCGEEMMIAPDGSKATCPKCGTVINKAPDIEPPEPLPTDPLGDDDRMMNFGPKCPHGNEWFACDACDRESDFQHDAARERRYFGR